jgi:hypothetical protein
VRIYLPATSTLLRTLGDTGRIGPAPLTAFAVTPGLREWYVDDEAEELEYAASMEAARASLRLLDGDPSAARRRVVVSLDAPEASVTIRDDLDRGVVSLDTEVSRAQIAAFHIDDAEAERTVAAAAGVIDRADIGDEDAQQAVDDAEGFELSWYDPSELELLLVDVGGE